MRRFAAVPMILRTSFRTVSQTPIVRRFVLLLALATLGACGSDSSTNPNADAIEGTYSLRTVNGAALPFTILSGANGLVLTSDVITITSNGTWSEAIQYRETFNGQTTTETDTDGGTWVRAGGSVTLQSNVTGDVAYSGAYANGSLTFSAGGLIAVFSR